MPVARTSSAVASPILRASSTSLQGQRLAQLTKMPHCQMITGRDPIDRYVPGSAEADVVGEDGGAVDVVVAVDGVGAEDDRDGEAGGEGELLHAVDHVGPVGGRGAVAGPASAAVEDGAGGELHQGAGRRDAALDLSHLCRLLPQGHAAQQVAHPRLHRRRRVLVQRLLVVIASRGGCH
jgi:hypothetical protein